MKDIIFIGLKRMRLSCRRVKQNHLGPFLDRLANNKPTNLSLFKEHKLQRRNTTYIDIKDYTSETVSDNKVNTGRVQL